MYMGSKDIWEDTTANVGQIILGHNKLANRFNLQTNIINTLNVMIHCQGEIPEDDNIQIFDVTPKFNNDGSVASVKNLQLQECNKLIITNFFNDYTTSFLQVVPCTI